MRFTFFCIKNNHTTKKVSLDKGIDIWANFGTHFFLERRELGLFNVGGEGAVTVDGVHATVPPAKCVPLGQLYFFS